MDKVYHLIAGVLIYILGCILTNVHIGIILCIVIGVGKEVVYDKLLGRGEPEVMDAVITIIPVIILYYISLYRKNQYFHQKLNYVLFNK